MFLFNIKMTEIVSILCEKLEEIYKRFEAFGGATALGQIDRHSTWLRPMQERAKRECRRWNVLAKHTIETAKKFNVSINIEYMAIQMDDQEVLELMEIVEIN